MYCRKCAYPLAELASSACPECGLAFDRADPRSFHAQSRSWSWLRIVAIGAVTGAGAGTVALLLVALTAYLWPDGSRWPLIAPFAVAFEIGSWMYSRGQMSWIIPSALAGNALLYGIVGAAVAPVVVVVRRRWSKSR